MGVPTLTLAGASSISRSCASVLQTLGLPEWVARTPDQFISLARQHADDLPALAALRAELRQRMLASPLMDAAQFTSGLEEAYRSMWRAHCARQVGS
jgi:predicted O-linked N-acetylglucosamine transferase (SPINDLY family)